MLVLRSGVGVKDMGSQVQDSGFRESLFRIQTLESRIQDSGFRIQDSGIQGLGFRVEVPSPYRVCVVFRS